MTRKTPAPTSLTRMRLRHKFDSSENALPILGDLVRLKRGVATRRAVGEEAGVGGHVVLDIENYFSAKQEELDLLLSWVGYSREACQVPPPIVNRAFGRPRLDGANEQPILEDILDWLAEGKPLSKYESAKLQVDSKRAKKMVTRYLRTSNEFRVAYAQARAVGAHHLADQIIDIADDKTLSAGNANNMIKSRMWLAARHNPAQFGDDIEANVNVNIGFGDALEQLERRRSRELAAPSQRLQVIDVEPLELQRADPAIDRNAEQITD